MKIIDNYLEPELYKKISSYLKSDKASWYFKKEDTNHFSKNKNGFFSFCFYNHGQPDHAKFYDLVVPILMKLDADACQQIRANLVVRDKDTVESGWHMDGPNPAATTGILYLTNCNSKTVVKTKDGDVFVDSIENRMLLFPQNTEHKVIYQTDVHKRYVINFNYFGQLWQ